MMTVNTYVAPSQIEGVGVFAAAPIKAGALIWRFEPLLDRLLTQEELALIPETLRDFIDRYGYPHMAKPGITVLEIDNGRFMNHSETPNTDFRDADFGYTLRDVPAGEELTCNYAEFDPMHADSMRPARHFVPRANGSGLHL